MSRVAEKQLAFYKQEDKSHAQKAGEQEARLGHERQPFPPAGAPSCALWLQTSCYRREIKHLIKLPKLAFHIYSPTQYELMQGPGGENI